MPNQYEKLIEQQARLKQKIEREDFKCQGQFKNVGFRQKEI
ncbi:hypothetical protein N624_0025 [Levilactobacillus brevis]|nr:hypothetical protein N624_0025 [Levilactobacillus brevis]